MELIEANRIADIGNLRHCAVCTKPVIINKDGYVCAFCGDVRKWTVKKD